MAVSQSLSSLLANALVVGPICLCVWLSFEVVLGPLPSVTLVEAKAKEETTLLARSFAIRETALKQELACLRGSEKDLSKRLHDRYPCKSGSLSWKRQPRHPKPRWQGLKKGPSIEKCSWVVWRPRSANNPRGSKKPRLS